MSRAFSPFVYLSTCLFQLGISTVALSVPIVLLRRQRTAQALTKAPPPRRRAGPSPIPRASSTAVPTAVRVEPIQVSKTCKSELPSDLGFNGASYSAKAFGIATTLVTVGAFVGVWAVQASLGVQNVCGMFRSRRTHRVLMLYLPKLDRRVRDKDEETPNGENPNAFFPDSPTA